MSVRPESGITPLHRYKVAWLKRDACSERTRGACVEKGGIADHHKVACDNPKRETL
jgi:hypothetical protein